MSGQESPATATNTQIMMRAPEGEVGWVMIDMQGTLETRNGQPLDGVEFGTLIREDGIPKLVMGKTQLEGSEVKFKKPLAVMDLVKLEDGHSEYQLKGVIRSKVVFKARPVPRADPLEPSTIGYKRTREGENAAV